MIRVDFVFDNARYYALYEVIPLDGVDEYYLELRDRSLISEFGLDITFKRDRGGCLQPSAGDTPRKIALLQTILRSIDQEATSK